MRACSSSEREKQGDISQPLSDDTVKAAFLLANTPHKDRDRTVPWTLDLAINAPVSLTYNIEQRAGLCNGTKRKVFDFVQNLRNNRTNRSYSSNQQVLLAIISSRRAEHHSYHTTQYQLEITHLPQLDLDYLCD